MAHVPGDAEGAHHVHAGDVEGRHEAGPTRTSQDPNSRDANFARPKWRRTPVGARLPSVQDPVGAGPEWRRIQAGVT